jgi:hypothetical protein
MDIWSSQHKKYEIKKLADAAKLPSEIYAIAFKRW